MRLLERDDAAGGRPDPQNHPAAGQLRADEALRVEPDVAVGPDAADAEDVVHGRRGDQARHRRRRRQRVLAGEDEDPAGGAREVLPVDGAGAGMPRSFS